MKKTIIILALLMLMTKAVHSYDVVYELPSGKEILVTIPDDIYSYEYMWRTGKCDLKSYWCRISYINMNLIMKWMKPFYK